MLNFYASNTATSTWEEEILGSEVLPSGLSVNNNIDGGTGACMFDLKAVFTDGDAVIRNNFSVCTETGWSVFES